MPDEVLPLAGNHNEDPEEHMGDELPDPWGDGLNHDWLTLDDAPKEVTGE